MASAPRNRRTSKASSAPRPRASKAPTGARAVKRNGYQPLNRHRLIVALLMVAALAVSARLVWVQGINSAELAAQAQAARMHTETVAAKRGDIVDRNGNVLATSVERYKVEIDQRQMPDYGKGDDSVPVKGVKGVAQRLAPLLSMSVSELEGKLTGTSGYVVLTKDATPQVRNAVRALGIGGVTTSTVLDRQYPAGQVAGNILGFVGADGTPLAGAELTMDSVLSGTDGSREYQRGAGGQIISSAPIRETPAVDGKGVQLTIDRDIQYKAQELIAKAVEERGAKGGSVVVLDPHTGEVFAIADYPTYDPNDPGATDAEYRGNQSISNVFEPGSTGKLITVAGLFEEGKATVGDKLTIPYTMDFNGELIRDASPHPTRQFTLAGVIKNSSNVGTVQLALRLENSTRYEYFRKFGLGQKTGIELPGESVGILHPAEKWHGRTQYATAFGHGYSVTALQMTSAIGAFGNDGVIVKPRIVAAEIGPDGTVVPRPRGPEMRAVSSETAKTVRQLMDNNVPDDGKSNGNVPHYAVGGKSGTAGVSEGIYTSSFIGMAPMDDPQLVVGVFFFGVPGFQSGTQIAAPVFGDMMAYALQARRIAPTGVEGVELVNEW